MIGVQKKQFKV